MNHQTISYNLWIESEEGKLCSEINSIRLPEEMQKYLKNRLLRAYEAGYDNGIQHERAEIVRKFEKIVLS